MPARTAYRLGPGADAPWACSQVEAIMATIVSIVEGWMGTQPTTESRCVPTRPDLRGILYPPTLDLFW